MEEPRLKKKGILSFKGQYLYSGIIVFILLFGFTYSLIFFIQNQFGTTGTLTSDLISVQTSEDGTISLTNPSPVSDEVGLEGISKTLTITNTSNTNINVKLSLKADSGSNIKTNSIRYGVYLNNVLDNVDTLSNSEYLYEGILLKGETITLDVYLWVIETYDGDGTTFNGKFKVDTSNLDMLGTEYINRLTGKEKGLYAINNDGNLSTNNENIREYRYSGESPDNYVWFNCKNNTTSGSNNCELWRIVGSFNVKGNEYQNSYQRLKLVKEESLESQTFGTSNDYSSSSLNTYLNETYYNSLTDTAKSMILDSVWNTGSTVLTNTPNASLESEQASGYTAKVGLLSASDFGYSTSTTNYSKTLNDSDLYNNSWLKEDSYYTISPVTSSTTNIIGNDGTSFTNLEVTVASDVKPSVYLSPTVSIKGGNGTEDKPYELALESENQYYDDLPTYEVNYNGNKFNTVSRTISGVTIDYDPVNSYLTFNGTVTTNSFSIIDIPETYNLNDVYQTTLTHISGDYTTTGGLVMATEVLAANKTGLSPRVYANIGLIKSGYSRNSFVITEGAVNEGKYTRIWCWFEKPTETTFNDYKIKINITKLQNKKITINNNYVFPDDIPTRLGYTFKGWYTDETDGIEVTNETKMTTPNDHSLYAGWTPNEYTVTYDSGNLLYGLNDVENVKATYMTYNISDKVVTVTADADDGYGYTNGRVYLEENKTYQFDCTTNGEWGVETGADTVQAFFMLNGSTNVAYYYMQSNNYTFTPTVSGIYWLRLDVNQSGKTHTFSNISVREITEKTVTYTDEYIVPSTPVRTGYTFTGWYYNLVKAVEFKDSSAIRSATGEYLPTYAGVAATPDLIPIEGGTTLYSNIVVGGVYSYDKDGNFISRVSSYTTVHKIPSNAAYIRIELNTSSTSFDTYMSDLIITDNEFALNSNIVNSDTTMSVIGDHTLYASWTPNNYEVTYDYNNNHTFASGTYADTGYYINWDKDFKIEETINVTTSGLRYLIIGNYTGSDAKALNLEVYNDSLRVYFANGKSYTVQGTIVMNEDINVVFNWDASIDTYTITAIGTSTNISFSGTYAMSGTSVNPLRIGTADWRGNAVFNPITVKSLRISNPEELSTSYSSLPTPIFNGYTFTGWYYNLVKPVDFKDSSAVKIDTGEYKSTSSGYAATPDLIPIKGGTTLYSNMVVCGVYSYDVNGNYISRASTYATVHSIPSNASYIRIELNTSSTSFDTYMSDLIITDNEFALNSNIIDSNTVMSIPSDHTLYARLIPNNYEVTYDYNSNHTFASGTYSDTGYYINWDKDFKIEETINVTTSGLRYLIIGNYTGSDANALNLEVYNDSLRVYFANGKSHTVQGTIVMNEDINVVFNWDASIDTYTITAIGTSTNISFSGTYAMSGTSVNPLRIGTADWRGNAVFNPITVKSLKISNPEQYDTTYSSLPTPVFNGYTFNGWYTTTSGGTEITSDTIVGNASDHTLYARWK